MQTARRGLFQESRARTFPSMKSVASIVLLLLTTGAICSCGYMSASYAVNVYYEQGNKEKVKDILTSSDPFGREAAVLALPKMGECTSELYAMRTDRDSRVRAALAASLGQCNTSEAMDTLLVLLKDQSPLVKKNAVESANKNDYCRSDCLFQLRKTFDDTDLFTRIYAAKALYKRFPEESRMAVIDGLSSKMYIVKTEAISALSLFKNPNDIYYLSDFLNDDDVSLRTMARKSIEQILGRPLMGTDLARVSAKEAIGELERDQQAGRKASAISQKTPTTVSNNDMPELSAFGLAKSRMTDKDAIAVIIGNKDYASVDIPDVNYALRDAQLMKQVAQQILGISANNVIYIEDAKSSDFNKLFGTAVNPNGLLANWAKPTSNIFIYYSGHGSPDARTKEAYFVPVDSDINYIALSGYPVKQLYQNLGKLHAKSITVVLDACFSGLTQAGTITKSASPVFVNVASPAVASDADMIIISSSRADEISTWDDEHMFGLFTYNFVKGLKEADVNHDEKVTVQEMEAYLVKNVSYSARRLMNRDQNPQIVGVKSKVIAVLKD